MKYALENGIIDLAHIQEQIEMIKRKELLEKHPYKIWQGKNGKWYTYIPDDVRGRIQKERKTKNEIEECVITYWNQKLENPTIREVFNEWNDRKLMLEKISPATHLRNTQIFDRHFKDFCGNKIKSVSPDTIQDFLEEQIAKYQLTAKAFSNLKGITKGFLKRAKKRKLIDFNVEELFTELDVSDNDFKKVIKEDYEEVFSEEESPIIIDYLRKALEVDVYTEEPEKEGSFVVLERTGGSVKNYVCSATLAIQSYAPTMQEAAELNEKVKKAMDMAVMLDAISKSQLNSDYNFTDTTKKLYRYQAVYDLVFFND